MYIPTNAILAWQIEGHTPQSWKPGRNSHSFKNRTTRAMSVSRYRLDLDESDGIDDLNDLDELDALDVLVRI